jgi:hypothetical protein
MMIWDCISYWREHRLVAARLELWRRSGLDVTVVAFVGDRTHRGNPKPAGIPDPPAGVRVVNVTLDAGDDWGRERQQRDAVTGLVPKMAGDDLVLLCDADEIVDPAAIPRIVDAAQNGPARLMMAVYMFDTRWRTQTPWSHPVALLAKHMQRKPSQRFREKHGRGPRVRDAGWHLTYQDDVDAKLSAFAHAEVDTPEFRRQLEQARTTHIGLDGIPFVDQPLTGPLADVLEGET